MKRTIFITIVLLSMLINISFAESGFLQLDSFALHNNIQFGMDMDQVRMLETMKVTGETTKSIQAQGGTIAGYTNTGVHYEFNSSGNLYYAYYFFDSSKLTSKDKVNKEYLDVRQELIETFGEPIGYSNGVFYEVTGEGIEHYLFLAKIGKYALDFVSAYDEWVIELPEGYVKIEHFACFQHGQKFDTGAHHICFQFFTKKEWSNASHGLK